MRELTDSLKFSQLGSPFRCDVVELPAKKGSTATARGEGLNQVILGSTAYFEINPHSFDPGQIEVQVIGTISYLKSFLQEVYLSESEYCFIFSIFQ